MQHISSPRRPRARMLGVLASAAVLILGLSACAGNGSGSSATGDSTEIQTGGVAEISAFTEFSGFDPVQVSNVGSGLERAAAVMDTLLLRDERTDEIRPKLAKGMSSEDGLTWVMELREGVMFSDGTPLDAEAVVFNIERHIAPDSLSMAKSLLVGLTAVEATGPLEVTFTLDEANGSFPVAFSGSSPASLIGSPAALADPETFNASPVGAGPFVFESWVRDDKLTLVKNENYWEEGKPYLDGVVYTVMPDNQTSADDLIAGGSNLSLINAAHWNRVSATSGLVMYPSQTGGAALIPNASRGPGSDPRVREAISYAFDGTTTARVLFGGTEVWDGDTSCVPFPKDSPACAEGTVNAQDIDKAKSLVAEYVADGGDTAMDLVHFSTLGAQATYIQQVLAEIGLDVSTRSVDLGGLTQAQASGDYDLFWGSTASSGYPTVWTRYYSEGTNWGMVTHPELDAALLEARNALELDDRNAAWRDVNTFIYENSILTWLIPYSAAMVHTDNFHLDMEGYPYGGSTMVYLDSAWLEQ